MPTILVIDDEKAIRKTLNDILSYEGYAVEEAADGEQGLNLFKQKTTMPYCVTLKCPN